MSELTPKIHNNEIPSDNSAFFRALAHEFIAEPHPPGSLRPLRRQIKKALRTLRQAEHKYGAKNNRPGEERDGFCEWLNDNYYLLMREGASLLTSLKYADAQPSVDNWPATCLLLKKLVQKTGVPDAKEFDELVETLQKVRPLTVFELEQLPLCLRAALILTAAEACGKEGSEAERLISIAVTGLRQAVGLDFADLTERHSIVERILNDDPVGIYPKMDEKSRAEYRRLTALAAIKTGRSEAATAADMIEQAKKGEGPRERHVGAALTAFMNNRGKYNRGRAFLISTLLIPAFFSILLAAVVNIPALALVFYLPLIELFKPLLQQIFLKGIAPVRLPRIELGGVIPEEGRTVITVSTLLPGAKNAKKTAEHLFRLYNTNGQGAVQVCLLADLKQADYPTLAKDSADIAAMRREIVRLNRKYGNNFVLAVRPRRYSPTMNAYTGYERKRGAITELVRVIKGAPPTFLAFEGDLEKLRQAKYILALDADTGMLLDTAAELVGAALHPLVQPQIDWDRNRVVKGYGILIPRIGTELLSANNTAFSRATSGIGGITPYDTTASDFYMDCFSSAIFTGKGLINVDAFSLLEKLDLPKEQILSHDIIEGCILRTGLVSDVEMTDGTPSAMGTWLDRLHRWIRGDWQNMPLIFNKELPLSRLDKWKMVDNLRRSITPAASIFCLLISPFFGWHTGQVLALTGLLCPISGNILSAVMALIRGGWLALGGRYYSRVLPNALRDITQAWFTLIMLPATSLHSLDAVIRALTRLATRRKMLEWTTAAQAEKHGGGGWDYYLKRFWPTIAIAAYLIYFGLGFTRLAGIIFATLNPFAVYSGRQAESRDAGITISQREQVHAYAAAAWRYYEEQCTAENNYLPPDNLQESPVWRVAHKTSPTNIGLYLLCVVAAHDFGFIDDEGMLTRIENTLTTIEKLEKWNGNLLNWYDTKTLRPLIPRYVSTVDSGNFACSLVALRQALHELKSSRAEAAAERARKIQEAIDLKPLYNRNRALFHIGLDPDTGELSGSYYDLLMSESRMTGYYAIAKRIVPKKHWGALGRTLTRSGNAIGPVSWTGTMFEYFMPRLFLPAEEGTMEYEALRFCLYCQRRRPPYGIPWGISESGFYAFDSNLNYQYKAHGVPRLALKRGLGRELVVSPYSSFLALTTAPDVALRNLSRLERFGMTGNCGFYEAIDFTKDRAARGGYSIVRSYMAHHVGMSLLACANAVMDDIFVRRFIGDQDMARAIELCYEKAPVAGAVYETVRENNVPERPGRTRTITEEIRHINPRTPRMHLLAGMEWQLAITDTGAGVSFSRGLDINRFSGDLLRNPQGIFAFVDAGDGPFSITAAPDYTEIPTASGQTSKKAKKHDTTRVKRGAEFESGAAIFTAQRGNIEAGMRAMVHPRISCEQRQVVVKNHGNAKINATVMFYFEPSLARREDSLAHPAFSRIFLSTRKDDAVQALFVTRRRRMGEPPVCLAIGLLDGRDFEYEPSREKLLERPLGLSSLANTVGKPFSSSGEGIPDCAVAIRVKLEIPPHTQKAVTMVLTAAPSASEAANRLIEVRREGLLSSSTAASTPFSGVEAELATQILPDLFYPPRMLREWAAAARENNRGQEALWPLGISGDFPIILVEIHNAADASRAEPYMRLHRSLLLGGVPTELAIVYHEGGEYNAPVLEALREAARDTGCTELLDKRAGIHLINIVTHGDDALKLLTAVCAHNSARDLSRPGVPPADFVAARIQPAKAVEPKDIPSSLEPVAIVSGGMFRGDRFIVTESPKLPWCHIIANEEFGTLVSDMALGFTWAVNSRENKLTPWANDTSTDNRGEMLLLKTNGTIFDTIWGARAEFGEGYARYYGRCGDLNTTVTVSVPKTGSWKKVELMIENTGGETVDIQTAYYTEPVMGVNRNNARHTKARWENGVLLLSNPFAKVRGSAFLTALGGADDCDCDRGNFLTGSWGGGTLSPIPDPCAAVIVRRKLPPRRQDKITFVLGFVKETEGENAAKAVNQMIDSVDTAPPLSLKFPSVRTPDPLLNILVSHWMPWQALICRMYARTGFYQCSGAWGFRDQLQDSLAALWFDPGITRRQILRCAAAQFEEGDVLHWWYDLPEMFQGVRTHCSDDLVWLPYVTSEYVEFTGDTSILEEETGWHTAPPLGPEEADRYFKPERTDYKSPLYEHCIRALRRACTKGEHGLPLIGTCDWNDGFSHVGFKGRGESVWLAMFLSITLDKFAAVCTRRGDGGLAEEFRKTAAEYRAAADSCFAGDRYIRAFYDDGTPLGIANSGDCEIDSIAQSFAVLAGLPEEHTNIALDTALKYLVDKENGIVKLLYPPFARSNTDKPDSKRNPGYISAYPPGLRENGGQYTHAAVWLAIALFEANRPDEGLEILKLLSTAHKYALGFGEKYKGEPYALAGDVYAHPECPGRAGWTQYTGSAGWYYTAVLRHLLGLNPKGDRLEINPRLPSDWDSVDISIETNGTPLKINISRGETDLKVDGENAQFIPLDGKPHQVNLVIKPA